VAALAIPGRPRTAPPSARPGPDARRTGAQPEPLIR
jgi:hypothetical protein